MTRKKVGSEPQTRKKKIWIVILSILLVAIIATMIILIVSKTQTSKSDTDTRSFEEIFWDSETAEEAIATFQKKIDATTDPEQKAELYAERAEMLFILFSNERLYSKQILKDAENAYTANMENLKYLYQLNNYCTYFSEETKDSNCQKETPTLIKRKDIQ